MYARGIIVLVVAAAELQRSYSISAGPIRRATEPIVKGDVLEPEPIRRVTTLGTCSRKSKLIQKSNAELLPTFDAALKPVTDAFRNVSLKIPFDENSIRDASHHGGFENWYRVHRALQKLLDRRGLTVLVIGGSVTAECGAYSWRTVNGSANHCGNGYWVSLLVDLFKHNFNEDFGEIKLINMARGGSSHAYALGEIAKVHDEVGPVDIVISEYHFNEFVDDLNGAYTASKVQRATKIDHSIRQLVSIVMSWPTKPAFMFLDIPKWFKSEMRGEPNETKAVDWLQAPAVSSGHWSIAKDLHVPLLWYSDAVRASGSLNMPEYGHGCPPSKPDCYPDWGHPSWFPGHYVMASIVYGTLHRELLHVYNHGIRGADSELPALDTTDTAAAECHANPLRQATAFTGSDDFQVDISGSTWRFFEDVRDKPGWIAMPGAPRNIVFKNIPVKRGVVNIGYLRSYEAVGDAECQLKGATDEQTMKMRIKALWKSCSSQTDYAVFTNVTTGTYDLSCLSDGQKFKIVSLTSC